jgi:hypothetical protein
MGASRSHILAQPKPAEAVEDGLGSANRFSPDPFLAGSPFTDAARADDAAVHAGRREIRVGRAPELTPATSCSQT